MATKKSYNSRLGLFILISFLLFVGAILILGRKRNLFQQTVKISSVFKDVRGLQVGNNVRFTGIEVGAITGISILSDTAVSVILSIDKSVTPYIKADSRATIGTDGLMGNKIVIILPGTPGSNSIRSGDQLLSMEPIEIDDIIREIQKSSEKISEVANNLIEITEKINRGDGIFGKLFTDSELTLEIEKTGKNIELLTKNLNELSKKINAGEGLVGRVLMDTTFADRLDITSQNIALVSENLKEFTASMSEGKGIMGQLFADTSLIDNFYSASKNLEKLLGNLAEVSIKLNNEDNALNKFIADTAFADSVDVLLMRMNKGVVEVTEASEALQRSGLVRAFSKDEEKLKKKEERKRQRQAVKQQK
jgi:phospholipid/cholesterol/gamma-HCH transport system substrate-binding protein